ncbi:nucleotidyltransferase family protein [Gimesia aquarii]|uniref:D-glycero-alpha-D-manno-heptose 1-phosphate guanylyltransferase n=1 Tax=Gimesia aquarii TaxID=2527964 RepID=A0A517W3V5_9PLAN|nr:nucleotidyltransferase family protein [Gimesia aquarii]QDT99934.1 D-glycero-alpha-D-manno-heptose 1-phosphate guanylyltransferase [Gimesia aquarii]
MEAIVLSGGLGTRLRSVVSDLPKPMAPISGKPFLEYQLNYWITQGVDRFILAVSYKSECITQYFGNSFRGVPIDYSFEDQPLGTGGAIREAMQYLSKQDIFLLLNGDTFFDVPLSELKDFHKSYNATLTFSCYEMEKNERYTGILIDTNNKVTALNAEVIVGNQQSIKINGGVYLVDCEAIKPYFVDQDKKHSFEQKILPSLVADHNAVALTHHGYFIDIGIPSDFERAQTEILKRIK